MATTTLRKSNTNLCIFTILSMQEILKKIQRAKHKLSAFLKSIKPKNKIKTYLRFRSTLRFQLQSNIR